MKKRARDLTAADCEGDAVLAVEIKTLLRAAAEALELAESDDEAEALL